jgi:hypothetical protein
MRTPPKLATVEIIIVTGLIMSITVEYMVYKAKKSG